MLKIELTVNLWEDGKLEYSVAGLQSIKSGDPSVKVLEVILGTILRDTLTVIAMLLPRKVRMSDDLNKLANEYSGKVAEALRTYTAQDLGELARD